MSIKSPYLNDIEQEKITTFCNDSIMFEAVRKVMLAGIYENGTLKEGEKADPSQNFALYMAFQPNVTDEELAKNLRASASGIRLVESGFTKLKELKIQEETSEVEEGNPVE